MKSNITILCKNIKLEAVLKKNTSRDAVIITHSHPLYGGNMDNPVVTAIAQAFFENKFSTLKFNFRGTGNSTGMFDNGNGEQEDVKAAISYLKEQGYENIHLAGYSFGARINALIVSKACEIKDHIMVSPPMDFISFDDIETMPSTGLIVTGDADKIAPAQLIQNSINRWKIAPRYEIIKNCDHFYSACLPELTAILTDYLKPE